MSEPINAPIDLSTGEAWRGLKPGMARADALRVLEATGAKTEDDHTDPGWVLATAEEWGMEMRFAEDGEQPLRQLVLDDWECLWNGKEIADLPLHEALAVLGDAARDAKWRPEDAVTQHFEDLHPPDAAPCPDEMLLSEGTLWLPSRGLGLVMCEGSVNEIAWRRPEDVPREFVGPVTEAQKQLTMRPDLAAHLRKARLDHRATTNPAVKSNPVQKLLTVLLILTFAYLGWQGWQEVQRWQHAQTLTGKLVSIEKATRKPWVDRYTIKYNDPTGRSQTAILEHGEFYVAPREAGEETPIAYLAGDPPRVKGLARAKDSAFLEYVPKWIGAAAIYLVLWTGAGFVGRLRRSAPSSGPTLPTPPAGPSPFTPDRGR